MVVRASKAAYCVLSHNLFFNDHSRKGWYAFIILETEYHVGSFHLCQDIIFPVI